MSWHFSQALEAAFLAESCSGGEPCAPWKSIPSALDDSCSDRMKDILHRSPFGTMFVPSTDSHGAALLTWFRVGFLAPTLAPLATAKASKASKAASGERWRASFAKFDPATSSWKTHQLSLAGALEPFSETWPRSGLMRNGMCWERTTLAPITAESESGLLPTPRASDGMKHPIRPAKVVKAAKRGHAGRLEDWVAIEENVQLGDRVYLSPDWLESVMQWPIMWSASTPLETAKFQQWLQQHGIS
jgi:hypothetical protein